MKNNKLRKGELADAAEVSEYTMSKLVHDESVSPEAMMKFCVIFRCDIRSANCLLISERLHCFFLMESQKAELFPE